MPLVPWVPLVVSEEYWAVQPHNSRHTLAFHISMSQMVPPALLVVVQQMVVQQLVVQHLVVQQLVQVEIQVGIQLLLSPFQAMRSPAGLLSSFQSHH